jgi:hypothetical protein
MDICTRLLAVTVVKRNKVSIVVGSRLGRNKGNIGGNTNVPVR